MTIKRQFQGTSHKRGYFDRKVQQTRTTRLLSLGKIIPDEWRYVRITPLLKTDNTVTIRIDKLLGKEQLACNPTACTPNKQHS